MGLTNPAAGRHLAAGFARRCDADMDVATHNVVLCTLYHRRWEKPTTGIADKLIRHSRTDRIPEELRVLAAAVAEV